MSDMKCPICGKQMKIGTLDTDDSMGTVWMSIMPCNCVCSYGASKAVWEELIRTKKQLEIALTCMNGVTKDLPWVKRALDEIKKLDKDGNNE